MFSFQIVRVLMYTTIRRGLTPLCPDLSQDVGVFQTLSFRLFPSFRRCKVLQPPLKGMIQRCCPLSDMECVYQFLVVMVPVES